MTAVEITDELVLVAEDAEQACAGSHGGTLWPCCSRAGLGAVVPLIAEQVRADERRKVAEEIATAIERVDDGSYSFAYDHAAGLARDLRVPYCGHELHSADGGACPRCGHDPYAPVKVAVAEAEQVWTGEETR